MKQYSPEIEAIISDASATRLLALDSVGNVVETTRGNSLTSTHVPYWDGTEFQDSSISQNVAGGVSATFTLTTDDAIGFHEPDMVAYARNTNFPAPSFGVVVGQGVSITFPNDFTVADLVQAGVDGTAVGTDVLIAAGTYTGGVVTSLQGNGGAFEFSLPNLSLPDFSANDFTVFINIAGANNQVGVEITLIGTDPGLNITDLAVGTPAANSILALDANNNVVLTAGSGGGVSGTTGTIPVFDTSADGVGDSLITQTGAGVTFALGFADFNNTGGATTTTIFSDNAFGPAMAADLSLLQVGDVITVATATPVATFTVTDISNVPTSVEAERTTGPTTNLDAFASSVTRGAAATVTVTVGADLAVTGTTSFPNGLTLDTGGNIRQVNSMNISGAFGVNFNNGVDSGGTTQQSGFNVNSTGNTSISGNFSSFNGTGQTTVGTSTSSTKIEGTNVTNPAIGTTTALGIDENGFITTNVSSGGVAGTGLVRSDSGVLSIDPTFLSSGATINLPTANFDSANVSVESSVITTGGNVPVVQIVFNTGQVTGLVDGMTYSTYTHTFGGNTDVFSTVTWTYIAESNPDRAFVVGQSVLYAFGDNTTPVSDRGTDFAALGLLTPPTSYSVTEFTAATISTLGTGLVRADAGVLSIDTSTGQVILPAPDVIDHLTNPVFTTPTSITLSPTINTVGNYSQFLLSAFYVTGSETDPGTIIRTGTQTVVQTITTPMTGATATIPITGLVANTDYSFVIVVAFDGGYFVSEVEERLTANDTQPTVTISADELNPDAGDTVTLTVLTVDNEGDAASVQWQFDQGSTGVFVDLVGETNATYVITTYAGASHDGDYRVQAESTIYPIIFSNVLTLAEAAPPLPPSPGGGLTSIAEGSMMITNALGGNAGGGTAGDPVVSSAVFGSRYPEYGGQTVGTSDGFNMSAITFGDPLTGGTGSNFGNATGVTLAQFNAAGNTVTSDFPAGNGTEINSANGFNTAFGCSGLAPSTAGLYNLNINLASGESGLYQLEVGGGGGTTTFETPVTLNTTGTVSIFASTFIGLPGGTTQGFTLGPSTLDTSADCFIACNFPTDLGTVSVALTPATAALSFGYAGFSGDIRWFGFRGVPSDLGTGTHTLTVDGAPANSGPPLITWSGSITGSTAPNTATTFDLDVTIGSIGGGAITSIVVDFQGVSPDITLTEPVGGWLVGQTYSFSGLTATTNGIGVLVLQLLATNSEGTYTTILNTIT